MENLKKSDLLDIAISRGLLTDCWKTRRMTRESLAELVANDERAQESELVERIESNADEIQEISDGEAEYDTLEVFDYGSESDNPDSPEDLPNELTQPAIIVDTRPDITLANGRIMRHEKKGEHWSMFAVDGQVISDLEWVEYCEILLRSGIAKASAAPTAEPTVKRGRGRPKGSKDTKPRLPYGARALLASLAPAKPRGRPKGSKGAPRMPRSTPDFSWLLTARPAHNARENQANEAI